MCSTLTAAFLLCLALFAKPSRSLPAFQRGGVQCPADWLALGSVCWIKVPERLAGTERRAADHCRVRGGQLLHYQDLALCFRTGFQEADLAVNDSPFNSRMLRKRIMGNIGM